MEDARSGRIVLRLEVEPDADPIRGSLEGAGGELEFVGWVGLAEALGRICGGRGEQRLGVAPHDDPPPVREPVSNGESSPRTQEGTHESQ
jgi:hypothetical protein